MKLGNALLMVLPAAVACAGGTSIPRTGPDGNPGVEAVLAHIRKGFPQSIKVDNKGGADIVGLPQPRTSPCIKEGFQQLFYWETYFINQGLLRLGLSEQARHNVDNLLLRRNQSGIGPEYLNSTMIAGGSKR